MINLSIQNFIPYFVLYLSLLKIEEYQRKGEIEMERDPMVPPTPLHVLSLPFCLWRNFGQRISLIKKWENAEAKKNSPTRLNNNSLVSMRSQGTLIPPQGL